MNFIGLDLGTSALKGLLVDEKGKILKEAREEYALYSPYTGWSEQNPEDWLSAAKKVISALSAGLESSVAGISVGGQMHGLVILDGCDRVIRPCILWNDGRTAAQTEYLNSAVGTEKLISATGNIAFAGFTAPKLLWLKEHEPHSFARIKKIILPKDYLIYNLCGAFVTDYSDASGTLLLDVKNKAWSHEMLKICGITEEQLPKLCESFAPVGMVRKEYGLPRAVVAAGAGDNAAAAVGTGCVNDGDCNISLGTSGTLFLCRNTFSSFGEKLHSFAHANGKFHLMGCILSAASANRWWTEDILRSDYSAAEKLSPLLGKNDIYFLPYLSGERSPHNDVNARGAFIGLTHAAGREQLTLAVYEGVAFALKDCAVAAESRGVSIGGATVCGGGAKSALWRKILANVLGVKISTVETEQGPSYGAAMLAMVAAGAYKTVEEAAAGIVRRTAAVLPDPALTERYQLKYKNFARLYPALKGPFSEIYAVGSKL